MVPIEPIFLVGDEIDWFQRIPWHKEKGPFVVVQIYDNDKGTCVCGKKGKHQLTSICQDLPKQLVVVKVKDSNWILLDHNNGTPAKMASRFFRKVVE